MADVFIAYCNEDRERVRPIARELERRGHTVWWDQKIAVGQVWDETIEKAIGEARCVVVVWTERSVRSRWVRAEAGEGDARRVLVPVLLDDVTVPLAFRLTQTASLVDWDSDPNHAGIRQLLGAVELLVNRDQATAAAAPVGKTAPPPDSSRPNSVERMLAGYPNNERRPAGDRDLLLQQLNALMGSSEPARVAPLAEGVDLTTPNEDLRKEVLRQLQPLLGIPDLASNGGD